jgi:predicted SnoaL-like aldol condensation-catalyzing enzyme
MKMDSQSKKDAAVTFLQMVASGQVREAYDKYVGPDFRHHNPFFRGDAASLMVAMEGNARDCPDKVLEIKRTLEDEDLVMVHSHVRLRPGDRGIALMHLFRFEGNRVVEAWDIGQAVPEHSPNEHGMF